MKKRKMDEKNLTEIKVVGEKGYIILNKVMSRVCGIERGKKVKIKYDFEKKRIYIEGIKEDEKVNNII